VQTVRKHKHFDTLCTIVMMCADHVFFVLDGGNFGYCMIVLLQHGVSEQRQRGFYVVLAVQT
jgi:hypothetical protein